MVSVVIFEKNMNTHYGLTKGTDNLLQKYRGVSPSIQSSILCYVPTHKVSTLPVGLEGIVQGEGKYVTFVSDFSQAHRLIDKNNYDIIVIVAGPKTIVKDIFSMVEIYTRSNRRVPPLKVVSDNLPAYGGSLLRSATVKSGIEQIEFVSFPLKS